MSWTSGLRSITRGYARSVTRVVICFVMVRMIQGPPPPTCSSDLASQGSTYLFAMICGMNNAYNSVALTDCMPTLTTDVSIINEMTSACAPCYSGFFAAISAKVSSFFTAPSEGDPFYASCMRINRTKSIISNDCTSTSAMNSALTDFQTCASVTLGPGTTGDITVTQCPGYHSNVMENSLWASMQANSAVSSFANLNTYFHDAVVAGYSVVTPTPVVPTWSCAFCYYIFLTQYYVDSSTLIASTCNSGSWHDCVESSTNHLAVQQLADNFEFCSGFVFNGDLISPVRQNECESSFLFGGANSLINSQDILGSILTCLNKYPGTASLSACINVGPSSSDLGGAALYSMLSATPTIVPIACANCFNAFFSTLTQTGDFAPCWDKANQLVNLLQPGCDRALYRARMDFTNCYGEMDIASNESNSMCAVSEYKNIEGNSIPYGFLTAAAISNENDQSNNPSIFGPAMSSLMQSTLGIDASHTFDHYCPNFVAGYSCCACYFNYINGTSYSASSGVSPDCLSGTSTSINFSPQQSTPPYSHVASVFPYEPICVTHQTNLLETFQRCSGFSMSTADPGILCVNDPNLQNVVFIEPIMRCMMLSVDFDSPNAPSSVSGFESCLFSDLKFGDAYKNFKCSNLVFTTLSLGGLIKPISTPIPSMAYGSCQSHFDATNCLVASEIGDISFPLFPPAYQFLTSDSSAYYCASQTDFDAVANLTTFDTVWLTLLAVGGGIVEMQAYLIGDVTSPYGNPANPSCYVAFITYIQLLMLAANRSDLISTLIQCLHDVPESGCVLSTTNMSPMSGTTDSIFYKMSGGYNFRYAANLCASNIQSSVLLEDPKTLDGSVLTALLTCALSGSVLNISSCEMPAGIVIPSDIGCQKSYTEFIVGLAIRFLLLSAAPNCLVGGVGDVQPFFEECLTFLLPSMSRFRISEGQFLSANVLAGVSQNIASTCGASPVTGDPPSLFAILVLCAIGFGPSNPSGITNNDVANCVTSYMQGSGAIAGEMFGSTCADCYTAFVQRIATASNSLPLECSHTAAGTDNPYNANCLSATPIIVARGQFYICSGFVMDNVYPTNALSAGTCAKTEMDSFAAKFVDYWVKHNVLETITDQPQAMTAFTATMAHLGIVNTPQSPCSRCYLRLIQDVLNAPMVQTACIADWASESCQTGITPMLSTFSTCTGGIPFNPINPNPGFITGVNSPSPPPISSTTTATPTETSTSSSTTAEPATTETTTALPPFSTTIVPPVTTTKGYTITFATILVWASISIPLIAFN